MEETIKKKSQKCRKQSENRGLSPKERKKSMVGMICGKIGFKILSFKIGVKESE